MVGKLDRTPTPEVGRPANGEGCFRTDGMGLLGLVCDGVGGDSAGEIASSLAVTTFCNHLANQLAFDEGLRDGLLSDSHAQHFLRTAIEHAHRALVQRMVDSPVLEGMGTTLTGIWMIGDRVHLVNVGDSRVYRLRRGSFRQLTRDQSYVSRLVEQRVLTSDEARAHPLRNIIDQVVGGSDSECRPEVDSIDVAKGDQFLICSDGLPDSIDDRAIHTTLVDQARAEGAACLAYLEKIVLDRAGRDNITVALLRVGRPVFSSMSAMLQRFQARKAFRTPSGGTDMEDSPG